jgi:thiol-disulfide isomerase/thioredoxin
VVVLNFWFIQCKGCRKEMPYLNRLQEQFKGQKFKLISLAWNTQKELMDLYNNDKKKITINNQELDYDIIPDCKWISEKYFVYAYPTNFLIKNGKVKELLIFDVTSEQSLEKSFKGYKKDIQKLLKSN